MSFLDMKKIYWLQQRCKVQTAFILQERLHSLKKDFADLLGEGFQKDFEANVMKVLCH